MVFSTKLYQVSFKILKLSQEQLVKILLIMLSNMLKNMVITYFYFIGRKNVVACHKAGIMKMGDGLFIKIAS